MVDGPKAHKKKEAGLKTHYLRWLRALRRTHNEVGFVNTLPKVVEGSKAHSEGR